MYSSIFSPGQPQPLDQTPAQDSTPSPRLGLQPAVRLQIHLLLWERVALAADKCRVLTGWRRTQFFCARNVVFWGEADVLFQHARVEPANAANDAKRHVKSRNGGDGDAFEPADARYGGGQSPNGANVTKSPVPSGSP